jgi:DNA-binding XRE family transcriptional regulator
MSYRAMADQVGVGQATLTCLMQRGDSTTRITYDKLRRVGYSESDDRGARVSSLGVSRRLGALWAKGYSVAYLCGQLGFHERGSHILRAIHGQLAYTHPGFVNQIGALYDKLAEMDPREAGMSKQGVTYAQTLARRWGHAPPHCWDPDTIDDSDAIPEWTGMCGTPTGLHIHYRDRILPACKACLATASEGKAGKAEGLGGISGARLRAARKRRGVSVKELADILGVNPGTVYYWEGDRSYPRTQDLRDRLLVALGCTYEDLREEGS